MRCRCSALSSALLVVGLLSPAVAQDVPKSELEFSEGQRLARDKPREAQKHFLESYRLDPTPSTALNLAVIYARLAQDDQRLARKAARPAERDAHLIEMLRWSVEAHNWARACLSDTPNREEEDGARKVIDVVKARVAVIEVATDPPGARIRIDGIPLSTDAVTPQEVAVAPGHEHTITVTSPGYRSAEAKIAVTAGQTAPLPPLVLARSTGKVRVTSSPPAVRIAEARTGKALGIAPTELELQTGPVELVATLPRHLPASAKVEVVEDDNAAIAFTLVRDPSTLATLAIEAHPVSGTIQLNGLAVGATPLRLTNLEPGPQEVQITREGYRPWRRQFVATGLTTWQARVVLEPDIEERRWWKPVAYGAGGLLVAVGGGVGLAALGAKSDYDAYETAAGKAKVDRLNLTADVLMVTGLVALVVTAAIHYFSAAPRQSSGEPQLVP